MTAVTEPPKTQADLRFVWRHALWPLALSALLIALLMIAHAGYLSSGGLRIYDEFHTLDRSSSFEAHGTWWTTYSFQEPIFRKPPLQYWMTAGFLQTDLEFLTALRLPSFLFAALALAAVGLLAAAVLPGQPWAIPAAVLIFAGSAQFWHFALSAMLETGAVAFATASLAAAILATRQPAWWYACAAFVSLGALQKAPIGLVLVAVYLWALRRTEARHGLSWARIKHHPAFRRALRIAIVGVLAWPVLQTLLHGPAALWEFFGKQMVERFAPTGLVTRPRGPGTLYDLLIVGEPALRLSGAAALALLPWYARRPDLWPLTITAGIGAAGIALAAGHVTDRYALSLVPITSVALAALILTAARRLPRPWPAPVASTGVALVSAISLGPVTTRADLALETTDNYARQMEFMARVGSALQPEETLVVCTRGGPHRPVPALASHFGANGRPFIRLDSMRRLDQYREAGDLIGPLRGLCTHDDLAFFAPRFTGLVEVADLPPYVMWTAEGTDGPDQGSRGLPAASQAN